MKKQLLTLFGIIVVVSMLLTVGCLKDDISLLETTNTEAPAETLDATNYNEIDRVSVMTREMTPQDSLQALIDSFQLIIEGLEEELAALEESGGAFYSYASLLNYNFAPFGATGVTKIKVTSSHTNSAVEIPAGSDEEFFVQSVNTLLINEPAFEGNLESFSSFFSINGTRLTYNLYSHVSGIDSIFSAPILFLDIEYNGDNIYDIRISIRPQVNTLYPTTAMDFDYDRAAEVVNSIQYLAGINFNNSSLSQEEISTIADELLTKEVTGTRAFFRNTNLPVSYRQLFLDQGWTTVIIN